MVIFFSFTVLFGANIHEDLHEKLIVSPSKDVHIVEENLLTLKVYFHENTYSRELQEKHKLNFTVEKLGDYSMVVIKPIEVSSLKNELLILLHPLFDELFFIDDLKVVAAKPKVTRPKHYSAPLKVEQNILLSWYETIGLQWVALLILATIGLIMSLLNRRKLAHIEKVQKDLTSDQKNIENEINNLGEVNV